MGPGPGYVRGCFWCKTCSGWAYSDLSPRYALAAFVCTSRVLVTRCAGSTRADVDQRSVLNHLFCRSIFCAGSPLARCRWVALETEQTENIFCVALQVFWSSVETEQTEDASWLCVGLVGMTWPALTNYFLVFLARADGCRGSPVPHLWRAFGHLL